MAAHEPVKNPSDWTPYNSRLEFETAEFLFKRNQMSGGDIDVLLGLWAASLATHEDSPPFNSHCDMYDTIDSTALGDVNWESATLQYNGNLPEGEVPSWMKAEHEIWFRDPRKLVQNLLANPDFNNEFDYSPVQEYDMEGNHRFQHFMSGDWTWKQAVRHGFLYHFADRSLILLSWRISGYHRRRSKYPRINVRSHHSGQRQNHGFRRNG